MNPTCRAPLPSRTSLNRHYGQQSECKERKLAAQALLRHLNTPTHVADHNDAHIPSGDNDTMDIDNPADDPPVQPRSVTVEDADDDGDEPRSNDWFESYPGAAATYGDAELPFHAEQRAQENKNQDPWAPFESRAEWELAEWMMQSGLSQERMNKLLKLD